MERPRPFFYIQRVKEQVRWHHITLNVPCIFANLLAERTNAGISGIFFGVASGDASKPWRGVWIAGLMLTATIWSLLDEARFTSDPQMRGNTFAGAAIGGFLVGIGTKLGSGCTSGEFIPARFCVCPNVTVCCCESVIQGMVYVG